MRSKNIKRKKYLKPGVLILMVLSMVIWISITAFAEARWDMDNYGFKGTWDQLSSKGTVYLYKGSSYKVGNKITVGKDKTSVDFTDRIKSMGPGTYHFTITDQAGRTWTSEDCQIDENMVADVGELSWCKENGYWKLRNYQGVMLTGWQQVDGKWYYLDTKTGICFLDTITPDGYYVDANGVWDGKPAK